MLKFTLLLALIISANATKHTTKDRADWTGLDQDAAVSVATCQLNGADKACTDGAYAFQVVDNHMAFHGHNQPIGSLKLVMASDTNLEIVYTRREHHGNCLIEVLQNGVVKNTVPNGVESPNGKETVKLDAKNGDTILIREGNDGSSCSLVLYSVETGATATPGISGGTVKATLLAEYSGANLYAYYTSTEGATGATVADLSTNSRDGTILDNLVQTADGFYNTNSVKGHINLPFVRADITSVGTYTLCVKVKWEGGPNNAWGAIVGSGNHLGSGRAYYQGKSQSTTKLGVEEKAEWVPSYSANPGLFDNSNWHSYCYVSDNYVTKVYVDNVIVGTHTFRGGGSACGVSIMAEPEQFRNQESCWIGYLDHVMFSTIAFTEAQVGRYHNVVIGNILTAPGTVAPVPVPLTVGATALQTTMCAYRGGTCILQPSGEITCTNDGSYKMNNFNYPTVKSIFNDRYVGIACQEANNKLCAISKSGKLRCWQEAKNNRGFPTFEEGLKAPMSGKYIRVMTDLDGSYPSVSCLRDDGVMEVFGSEAGNNNSDSPGRSAGLVTENGRIRKAPNGGKVVALAPGGHAGGWMESDGKLKVFGYAGTYIQKSIDDNGVSTNAVTFVRTRNYYCALHTDGTMHCAANSKYYKKTPTSGNKWTMALTGGYNHVCGIVEAGHVECFYPTSTDFDTKCPEKWEPEAGKKFVECTAGYQHTCCKRDDGVVKCVGNKDTAIGITVQPAVHSDGKKECIASNTNKLTEECHCSGTLCASGKYCYAGQCKETPVLCASSNIAMLTDACQCSPGNDCIGNQWCWENTCHDYMKLCPESNTAALTYECGCGKQNKDYQRCTVGKYCNVGGSSCGNNPVMCTHSWIRTALTSNRKPDCFCVDSGTGPICQQNQYCYLNDAGTDDTCHDAAKTYSKVIDAQVLEHPRMCGYRGGMCVVQPSDGEVECTHDGKGYEIRGFTYPKMTNPSGDKFVGCAAQKASNLLCLLTESGKAHCFDPNPNGKKYPHGDFTAAKGKYTFLAVDDQNSYPALMAIRDDGVMECFGDAKQAANANNENGGSQRRNFVPPTGQKTIGGSNNHFSANAWLTSNGDVRMSGYASDGHLRQLKDFGAASNVVRLEYNQFGVVVWHETGVIMSTTKKTPNVWTTRAKNGATFTRGGCIGDGHFCAITSDGRVECRHQGYVMDTTKTNAKYAPYDWIAADGKKFVECGCGTRQTCCAQNDNVIVCKNSTGDEAIGIRRKPLIAPCTVHDITVNAIVCTCGPSDEKCNTNSWCYDDACKTEAKYPACTANYHVAITNACACAAETVACPVGKFCYGSKCQDAQRCSVRDQVGKNVFYGAKVYGKWDAATQKMAMSITHPWTVSIDKVKWNGVTDTTLQYITASPGLWTKVDTDPCNPAMVLDVSQTTFFGAGSKFTIAGSQLSSSLRVEATEAVSTTKNGDTYDYNRSIKNTLPILVNLVTKTTIEVRFKTGVVTPRNDFVLFTGAEDNFYGTNPNVKITMEVHSGSCVDHSRTDKGVRVKTGADNIKAGQASLFAWKKDSNDEIIRDWQSDKQMCVETLTWTFVPKQYKDATYEIELEFVSVGTEAIFSTIAAIDIKQADVLDDIGFTSALTTYSDKECTTAAGKFVLGQKFFSKIKLSNLVINTASIACNTYKIKQTKNGQVTTTDLKAEAKYNFVQAAQTAGSNMHICGAELESHHFHVSVDGYDTVLETEILITYDQTNTRRQLVSIPLSKDYFGTEAALAESAALDDEDMKFRNTPRAPDTDDMMAEMVIESEQTKRVGAVLYPGTKHKLANLGIIVAIVALSGFFYGYFANKSSNPYSPLVEI